MPQPNRIFRLNDAPNGLGLSCNETGLALAGVPLLCKTASGFSPRARDEIDALLSYANEDREEPVALSASGLVTVADALNRGDLVKAQMTALSLTLSPTKAWHGLNYKAKRPLHLGSTPLGKALLQRIQRVSKQRSTLTSLARTTSLGSSRCERRPAQSRAEGS